MKQYRRAKQDTLFRDILLRDDDGDVSWGDAFKEGLLDTTKGITQLIGTAGVDKDVLENMQLDYRNFIQAAEKDKSLYAPYIAGMFLDNVVGLSFGAGKAVTHGLIAGTKLHKGNIAKAARANARSRIGSLGSAASRHGGWGLAQGWLGYVPQEEAGPFSQDRLVQGLFGAVGGAVLGTGAEVGLRRWKAKKDGKPYNPMDVENLKLENEEAKVRLQETEKYLGPYLRAKKKAANTLLDNPGKTTATVVGGILGYMYANNESGEGWEVARDMAIGAGLALAGTKGAHSITKTKAFREAVPGYDPDKVKAGLTSRRQIFRENHEYLDAYESAVKQARRESYEFTDIGKELSKLSKGERQDLYYFMQGELTDPSKLSPATRELGDKAINKVAHMGQMLVDAGLLKPETYQKHLRKYLHRTYFKHMLNDKKQLSSLGHLDFYRTRLLGNTLIKRKLMSKAERDAAGEMDDVAFAFIETGKSMMNDLASYNIFNNISKKFGMDKKVFDDLVKAKRINPEDFRRFENQTLRTSKVGAEGAEEFGGIKTYGKLAGQYVPKDIYYDIMQYRKNSNEMRSWGANLYLKFQNVWKKSLTVWNPPVHTNNTAAAISLFDASKGKARYAAHSLAQIVRKSLRDKDFEEARAWGVFDSDYISAELNKTQMKMLDDMQDSLDAWRIKRDDIGLTKSLVVKSLKRVSKMASWGPKKIDQFMTWLYKTEDNVFRYGMYLQKRKEGMSAFEASEFAKTALLDYNIQERGIRWAKNWAYPFASFTVRAAPRLLAAAAENPMKFMKWGGFLYAQNYVGSLGNEDIFNPKKKQAYLGYVERQRNRARGKLSETLGGVGIALPTSYVKHVTPSGKITTRDITRFIPGGDIVREGFGKTAFGSELLGRLPEPLQPNPLYFELMKTAWGLEDTTGKVEEPLVLSDYAKRAFKILPHYHSYEKIRKANAEAPKVAGGNPPELKDALMSAVGFKDDTLTRGDISAYEAARLRRLQNKMKNDTADIRRRLRNKTITDREADELFDKKAKKIIKRMEKQDRYPSSIKRGKRKKKGESK